MRSNGPIGPLRPHLQPNWLRAATVHRPLGWAGERAEVAQIESRATAERRAVGDEWLPAAGRTCRAASRSSGARLVATPLAVSSGAQAA